MNTTIDLLNGHRSIRRFTDTPIPVDLLERLIGAAQAAARALAPEAASATMPTSGRKRSISSASISMRINFRPPPKLAPASVMPDHRIACISQREPMPINRSVSGQSS